MGGYDGACRAIDEEVRGHATYAVLLGHLCAFAKDVHPRHTFLLDSGAPCVAVIVYGQGIYFESFVVELLIDLDEMWHLPHARSAPCGPEVQQHIPVLGCYIGQRNLFAIHSLASYFLVFVARCYALCLLVKRAFRARYKRQLSGKRK